MDAAVEKRLRDLRADYARTVGQPFAHFYCPILFRDEDVELCKAHIVNAAFSGSSRWTLQRKDVDNFYGSVFESEFVDLQHRGHRPDDVVVDKTLSKRFRPKFVVEGRTVDYYVPKGVVPTEHSPFLMDGKAGPVQIALKIHPSETLALADANWQIRVEKDLRIAALVSVLKAAHLTLFAMLGYQYALSPGGHLLGRAVLGEFFLASVGRPRPEVLSNATPYFREFAHMVRPVVEAPATFNGTAGDGMVYVCGSGELTWSLIVFVRTSKLLHAALVPVFQEPAGARRFLEFLSGPEERIEAYLTCFDGDRWMAAKDPATLVWPKTGILYPEV
jgi:hypothetical protein